MTSARRAAGVLVTFSSLDAEMESQLSRVSSFLGRTRGSWRRCLCSRIVRLDQNHDSRQESIEGVNNDRRRTARKRDRKWK